MVGYIENPPDASALMTSARSFGNYDLAGAIADLIDNSIKAKASRVAVWCTYNDGNPRVRIVDNGVGMSRKELHAAMRPASRNPTEDRSSDDLGRFGWGLKSASFSQAKRLTVLSYDGLELGGAAWDLDSIESWRMETLESEDVIEICDEHLLTGSGVEVIWEKCDRLSENSTVDQKAFNEAIAYAQSKLGLIFHRYISGETTGRRTLELLVNGIKVPEFDPFHRNHPATQLLEEEPLYLKGYGKIKIRPYILPHYSKLRQQEVESLAGDEGLVRNQGFYVYRNDRLIISGTWFRLIRHGELSQLVRVSVDIPNSLDTIWKVTIDKADAQLPSALRYRLWQILQGLKTRASKVQRSKGGRIDRKEKQAPLWKRYARNDEIRYEINRDHPLIWAIFDELSRESSQRLEAALRAIEQEFPVDRFINDGTERGESIKQSEANPEKFREFLKLSIPGLLTTHNGDVSAMIEHLRHADPYRIHWSVVDEYLIEEGWKDAED